MLLDLGFFCFQNLLTPFAFCTDLFILCLDAFAFFTGGNVFILKFAVTGHDLFHIVDCSQELIKISRTHKNIQNVITAALFHRPDAGTVFFELNFFTVDCRVQFFGLLGNDAIIHGDFFGNQGQSFLGDGILLFQSRLLIQHVRLLIFESLHILLSFLHLGRNLIAFLLQGIDIALRNSVSHHRKDIAYQRQSHQDR